MFNYTKAGLAIKANELNFARDTLEKVFRLADILDYINSNPIMKNVLALKGGTAINFTIFNLPRLSVDIDLDYCADESREEMLGKRGQISEDIKIYMSTQGYAFSPKSKTRHSLDSFVFVYKNLGGVFDNIKVEINYSLRAHIFEPEQRMIATAAIPINTRVYSLMPMEIFAAKINALLSRAAARDLYDVYNMINLALFDESEHDLLRKSVIFYTAISQEEIWQEYNTARIDSISFRKIKTDLLPVITKGEVVPLPDMKEKVKTFIIDLMVLTDSEKGFVREFANKQYKPDLLFSGTETLERIKDHPMVRWKMQEH